MTNNISTSLSGNTLTITVDLSKDYGRSSSGKTTIVASSQGNADIEGKPGMKLGLNIFKA